MTGAGHNLVLLAERFAICRLDREAGIPAWSTRGSFYSITRTGGELSVVCPEYLVPNDIRAERGWRALRVAGVLDFAQVGILAGLASPLAGAGISLFAVSTFDTDYMLVKEPDLGRAIEELRGNGYLAQEG